MARPATSNSTTETGTYAVESHYGATPGVAPANPNGWTSGTSSWTTSQTSTASLSLSQEWKWDPSRGYSWVHGHASYSGSVSDTYWEAGDVAMNVTGPNPPANGLHDDYSDQLTLKEKFENIPGWTLLRAQPGTHQLALRVQRETYTNQRFRHRQHRVTSIRRVAHGTRHRRRRGLDGELRHGHDELVHACHGLLDAALDHDPGRPSTRTASKPTPKSGIPSGRLPRTRTVVDAILDALQTKLEILGGLRSHPACRLGERGHLLFNGARLAMAS